MSNTKPSTRTSGPVSEQHGIAAAPLGAKRIYSVGISTAGAAEIQLALEYPSSHVVATTIDAEGAALARQAVSDQELSSRIEVKLEDVSGPLPYPENTFDYIYARLVLHYLAKKPLAAALSELYRVLKAGSGLFIVVRSTKCNAFTREGATYDATTGFTTYPKAVQSGPKLQTQARYFHTEESISQACREAGFSVKYLTTYNETLYRDFARTQKSAYADSLIELLVTKPHTK